MIEVSRRDIPDITTEQMIEVDRAMVEDFKIDLVRMMENAGRNLAHLARECFLSANPQGKSVLVMAGSGGNGGGALVAARRLSNWGADVHVCLAQAPERMTPVPAQQLAILQQMKVRGSHSIGEIEGLNEASYDLILDGLIGYSLKGDPYGLISELIDYANQNDVSVLSLDTPSGLDTTTGKVYSPAIRAAATLTLALPKEGLFSSEAQRHIGSLYLADISVPPTLYRSPELSIDIGAIFAKSDIIKIID